MASSRDILDDHGREPDLVVSWGTRPEQIADVFLPASTEPAPLVLLWHGGYWRAGHDRLEVGALATDLAARGYAVANMEYRVRSSGNDWTVTLTDVADGADATPGLVETAFPGRVDPARILYAGHSAGGHLAVWASLRSILPPGAAGFSATPPPVHGVLALGPVLDLRAAEQAGSGRNAVVEFLGGTPTEVPDRYAATDPVEIGAGAAPVIIVHGDADDIAPIEFSRTHAAQTGSTLVELAGADHFHIITPTHPSYRATVSAIESLLAD
ncbi:MAG: alpha/beta hydrolase [Glaciihabitans sp.]|nr:alpha/beta hydrolase [Glaciihabitans sp.]